MIIKDINIDTGMKELVLYENPLLQHSMYVVNYDNYLLNMVPWHWHDELELIYVMSGSCVYRVGQKEYELSAGDAIFTNSGVLHNLKPKQKNTVTFANLFKKTFISGGENNFWDITYVNPVLQQKKVDSVPIYKSAENKDVLDLIRKTIELCTKKPEFYEMRMRNLISEIWIFILKEMQKCENSEADTMKEMNDIRIKKIFLFVMEKYSEKISVADLAASVNISKRECYRLFQNNLLMSPNTFVQRYRMQIARTLLLTSNKPITEIAMETGFESTSYFSKTFKKYTGMTPMEMRKSE